MPSRDELKDDAVSNEEARATSSRKRSDSYDDLLESALNAIDDYENANAVLNAKLKDASHAFFHLARAKLALGPSRISPASFRNQRVEPVLVVKANADNNEDGRLAEFSLARRQIHRSVQEQPLTSTEKDSTVPDGHSAPVDTLVSGSEQHASGLTKRTAFEHGEDGPTAAQIKDERISTIKKSGDANKVRDPLSVSSEGDSTTRTQDCVPEFVADPMTQFSAFPPPSLRQAQTAFEASLDACFRVLTAQRLYDSAWKKVAITQASDMTRNER